MKTKEQCLLERIMSNIEYGRNPRLVNVLTSVYNQGKNYLSDCVFQNNESGLDYALKSYSPSEIIEMVTNEDSDYNSRYPFFILSGGGIKSIDCYDFQRMLKPEDVQKILSEDVLGELDDSDVFDAFESFVYYNYPQEYNSMNVEAIEDYTAEQFFQADWNELANSIMQLQVNEGRVLEMTDEELKSIIREGTSKLLEKAGIHIDPENKGKFTATKERTGKSTEELTHSKNPLTRKRAVFAQNAKKWNHSK